MQSLNLSTGFVSKGRLQSRDQRLNVDGHASALEPVVERRTEYILELRMIGVRIGKPGNGVETQSGLWIVASRCSLQAIGGVGLDLNVVD